MIKFPSDQAIFFDKDAVRLAKCFFISFRLANIHFHIFTNILLFAAMPCGYAMWLCRGVLKETGWDTGIAPSS
jgi:hypothetical protein